MALASQGDRAAFLERVRQHLHAPVADNPLRPVTGDGAPGPIDYAVDTSDLVGAFTAALTALTGQVHTVADRDQFLTDLLAARGARRAAVSRDPECDGVVELLVSAGVEVVPHGDVQAAARADVGITGALHGIALTGSLIVDSQRAGGRLSSLLPPVHVALLPTDRILPDPGAFLRTLGTRDHRMPSNVVLITGPSKSADIELILTIGVHGPKELVVGLLETS